MSEDVAHALHTPAFSTVWICGEATVTQRFSPLSGSAHNDLFSGGQLLLIATSCMSNRANRSISSSDCRPSTSPSQCATCAQCSCSAGTVALETCNEFARRHSYNVQELHFILAQVAAAGPSYTASHYPAPRPTSASERHKHSLALPSGPLTRLR